MFGCAFSAHHRGNLSLAIRLLQPFHRLGRALPPHLALLSSSPGCRAAKKKMLVAAAADRNKGPILEVLQQYVDPTAPKVRALEVASGTGQHCAHFAQALPNLHLVPSELDPHSRQSISAYISHWSLSNVEQPRTLDSSKSWETWGFSPNSLHLIICINMIHITEPSCTQPYSVNGILTPQSNVDFNISLKRRNPAWGIWDTSDLQNLATTCGMSLESMVDMPANNKCLIFRKK
eukprot:XP_012825818.1 PREDICTED: UPF0585 protein C16orf13 homolog isoform X1 [Xenopus tropicalis]